MSSGRAVKRSDASVVVTSSPPWKRRLLREAGGFMALRQDIGRRYGGRLWLRCQSKRLSVLLE
jgi:hypothetical protein